MVRSRTAHSLFGRAVLPLNYLIDILSIRVRIELTTTLSSYLGRSKRYREKMALQVGFEPTLKKIRSLFDYPVADWSKIKWPQIFTSLRSGYDDLTNLLIIIDQPFMLLVIGLNAVC